MTEILDTSGWKFYVIITILIIAAIVLVVIIGYPVLQSRGNPVSAGSQVGTTQPVTSFPVQVRTTQIATITPLPSPITTKNLNTTIPVSSTPTMVPTTYGTVITPVPFSLSVTPQSASGKPGDTLVYTLEIQHGEGLTGPIHFSLAAHVLFFSQTYDLGTIDPPFPKTITYDFTVPGNLPSGVTVEGVVTATGNSQSETQDISLHVQ